MSQQPPPPEPPDVAALTEALAAPFKAAEVKFKPAVVSGNRALALPYVTARAVQDRLDEVFGVDGWQDDYTVLPDNSVVCKLEARFGAEWVAKTDVGSPSEQPDEGDRMKAAFSDALKRTAVKLGIGRYLYRIPQQWVDYDAHKRQFTRTPTLPAWALPAGQAAAPAQPSGRSSAPVTKDPPQQEPKPMGGATFASWLVEQDRRALTAGLTSRPNELVHAVVRQVNAPAQLKGWSAAEVGAGVQAAHEFVRRRKEAVGATPAGAK